MLRLARDVPAGDGLGPRLSPLADSCRLHWRDKNVTLDAFPEATASARREGANMGGERFLTEITERDGVVVAKVFAADGEPVASAAWRSSPSGRAGRDVLLRLAEAPGNGARPRTKSDRGR